MTYGQGSYVAFVPESNGSALMFSPDATHWTRRIPTLRGRYCDVPFSTLKSLLTFNGTLVGARASTA